MTTEHECSVKRLANSTQPSDRSNCFNDNRARMLCETYSRVSTSNPVPTAQTCKYDSTHGNWKLHLSVRQAACHGYRQLSTPPCSIEANPLRFRVPSLLYQCANPPTDSLLSAVSV